MEAWKFRECLLLRAGGYNLPAGMGNCGLGSAVDREDGPLFTIPNRMLLCRLYAACKRRTGKRCRGGMHGKKHYKRTRDNHAKPNVTVRQNGVCSNAYTRACCRPTTCLRRYRRIRKSPGGGGLSEPLVAQGETSGTTSSESLATSVALLDSQTTGSLPLVQGTPKATLGTFVSEGLIFEVNEDGTSVALVGISATDLKTISVPTQVVSGSDTYTVTTLKSLGGGGIH